MIWSGKQPELGLKTWVLATQIVSLVILFAFGIYSVERTHGRHVTDKITDTMAGVATVYQSTLADDARQIAALLDTVTLDERMIGDLARKDRAALLRNHAPLAGMLRDKYEITHFYFSGPDRVNILRLHDVPAYGDTIDRNTTKQAERTGKIASGAEMGLSGLFTLRVVKPIYRAGRLVGFVELGREIEHVIRKVKHILGVNLYVTLFREEGGRPVVARRDWEAGMRKAGRDANWDRFPQLLLSDQTAPPSARVLKELAGTTQQHRHYDQGSFDAEAELRDGSAFVLFTPLRDASGREVGDLAVDLDFSATYQLARTYVRYQVVLGVVLILGLCFFLYIVLSRLQATLVRAQAQAQEAFRQREQAQQRHLEEMRAKKEEIEEQADRMAAIVDYAVEGIVTVDEQGRILSFNRAAGEIFGYRPDEVIGKNVKLLMPEPYRSAHDGYLAHYLATGEADIMRAGQEVEGLRSDGRAVPIHLAVSEVRLREQRIFTGIVYDISDRKRAEAAMRQRNEALERSNRELQDFAYVASHDLQEPLRKIRSFGDRLQRHYQAVLGEQGTDYLSRMLNAAVRMQGLISDLLGFSRISSQAKPFESMSLTAAISGVVSDLETRIEETGAKLEIGKLPSLDADPLQMRQLFQNLLGNALKFQREGVPPLVRITARALPPQGGRGGVAVPLWEIRVQDNGIGFDQRYAERIFQVFQRLHQRDAYEGTGVGLAICRKIVDRHDGTITAIGEPGQGATFVIVLPERHEIQEALAA